MNFDRIRDALNVLFTLILSAGFLLGFVLEIYLDYKIRSTIILCMPIVFIIVFMFVPDSPVYLARTSNVKVSYQTLF